MSGESRPDASTGAVGDEWLQSIAGGQAGFFTARQVAACGFGDREIADRVATGRWDRIERGMYRLGAWTPTRFDDLARWCAWYEGGAAVSHQTAAELHGMGRLRPRFVHVSTVDTRPAPSDRVAVHRRACAGHEWEQLGGFAVTTPERTVIDLAFDGVADGVLTEVVADGTALERLDVDLLSMCCVDLPTAVAERIERALRTVR